MLTQISHAAPYAAAHVDIIGVTHNQPEGAAMFCKPLYRCAPDCPEHLYDDWDSDGEWTREGDPEAAED